MFRLKLKFITNTIYVINKSVHSHILIKFQFDLVPVLRKCHSSTQRLSATVCARMLTTNRRFSTSFRTSALRLMAGKLSVRSELANAGTEKQCDARLFIFDINLGIVNALALAVCFFASLIISHSFECKQRVSI